jgi:hypothetical protein
MSFVGMAKSLMHSVTITTQSAATDAVLLARFRIILNAILQLPLHYAHVLYN